MIDTLPEHSLISCILLDSSTLDIVADIVEPGDFADRRYKLVYEACLRLKKNNTTIDPMTLYGVIGKEQTESIGGVTFYSQLINDAATSQAADYYAKLVRDDSIKRGLRQHIDVLSRSIRKDRGDIGVQLEALRTAVDTLESRRLTDNEVRATADTINDTYGVVTSEGDTDGLVRTGISLVDNEFVGLWPGLVTVVGGRTSMGKSAFCGNIAINAATVGKKILWISMEDTEYFCHVRMISRIGEINLGRILRKRMDFEDNKKLVGAVNAIGKLPISIVDKPGMSMDEIHAISARQQKTNGVDLLVIDHLGCVAEQGGNIYERASVAAQKAANMAKRLHIPVVLAVQLNRGVESREGSIPRLSDIRDSGKIEEIARAVFLLHRPHYYNDAENPNEMALICAKASHGQTGVYKLFCDLSRMYIGDGGY
jgi:replicative DNA helicase